MARLGHVAFALLILAPAMSIRADASEPELPLATKFVRSLKLGTTIADVNRLAPKGVRLSKPAWKATELALGTYVELSGALEGQLVFLNDKQRKAIRAHEGAALNAKSQTSASSDKLDIAMVDVGDAKSKKQVAGVIDKLSRLLGKPVSKTYEAEDGPDSGWNVKWKLSGKRSLYLMEDSTIHLILTFEYSQHP